MIGYKAFDENLCCKGFQYKVGKTYTKDVKKKDMTLCTDTVFHFCRDVFDIEKCSEYRLLEHRLCEVISGDDVISDNGKYGTNKITILREIVGKEKQRLINSVNKNAGYWNTGYWNTGNYNAGNWNTGNWNTGDWNTGFFNTVTPKFLMFNKECDIERDNMSFPDWLFFDITEWIHEEDATDDEKKEHEDEIRTCGGFLKKSSYKDAFKKAYDDTTDDDKKALFVLPNFDCDVFEEISGIDTRDDFKRIMQCE